MKPYLILIIIFLVCAKLTAQEALTSEEWREDLLYLQQKIHLDYHSLFRKISKEDFDQQVSLLYEKIPDLESHEIKVHLSELVSLFGYGHTSLGLNSWDITPTLKFHQLPINFYWFSDGVFVQGANKENEKAVGSKVIKIGNYKVREALELIKPITSAENDQHFKAYGLSYLGVPEILHTKGIIDDMSSVQFVLEKNGKSFNMEIKPIISERFPGKYSLIQNQDNWINAQTSGQIPLWLKYPDRRYFFEYLPNQKIVYIKQSSILDESDEKIPAFYNRVFKFIEENEVESMVLDLRLNSGGENFKIIPILTGVIKSPINQRGKFYVIIGRRTFSAAQSLVNELEKYTEAIFVGEPTAENVSFFGDTKTEILPNSKLSIRLSYVWWQNANVAPDDSDNRQWTEPDISAEFSSEDYIHGRDPVMQAILNYSPQPPLINLMTDAITNNGVGEAIKIYNEYKNNKIHKYKRTENLLNQLGYELMNQKNYKDAIVIFELNTREHPQSSNVWDSFAEAHMNNGNMDLAIKYYKRSLDLNPENNNAKEMLKKIRE